MTPPAVVGLELGGVTRIVALDGLWLVQPIHMDGKFRLLGAQ